MKAIDTFKKTIARASELAELRANLPAAQLAQMLNPDDLLRSALVIAVAAMDSYFTDRFSESLVPFLKKKGPTTGMVTVLTNAGLDTKAALEMITMDRPFRRIRTMIESYLSEYTTQKQDVIDKLFAPYGMKDLSVSAQGLSKKKKLLVGVKKAVQRRHDIVHGGDLNAHGKVSKIDSKTTQKHIHDIDLYVMRCEELLDKVLKPKKAK